MELSSVNQWLTKRTSPFPPLLCFKPVPSLAVATFPWRQTPSWLSVCASGHFQEVPKADWATPDCSVSFPESPTLPQASLVLNPLLEADSIASVYLASSQLKSLCQSPVLENTQPVDLALIYQHLKVERKVGNKQKSHILVLLFLLVIPVWLECLGIVFHKHDIKLDCKGWDHTKTQKALLGLSREANKSSKVQPADDLI